MSTSSAASQAKDGAAKAAAAGKGDGEKKEVAVNSYWGIEQSQKLVREDGTEWKWSCFRPWETYTADTTIDLTKHHVPKTMLDKIAYWTVKSLRFPTDIFFQAGNKGSWMGLEGEMQLSISIPMAAHNELPITTTSRYHHGE